MTRKKTSHAVLMGTRVPPAWTARVDAIVRAHARAGDGTVWTRSDALRKALLIGFAAIEREQAAAAEARAAEPEV